MKTQILIVVALLSIFFVGCRDEITNDKQIKAEPIEETTNNEEKILSDLPSKLTEEYLAELFEKSERVKNPSVKSETYFTAKIIPIESLWKNLQAVVFEATKHWDDLHSDTEYMIYHNNKVENFTYTLGGGLLSPLVVDDKLYFVSFSGFGVSHSSIGCLTIRNNELVVKECGSFLNQWFHFKVSRGRVYVIENYTSNDIGWLNIKENGDLTIITEDGTEYNFEKSSDELQTKPKRD